MNFREFIETKYDVRQKIKNKKSNPLQEFIDSDIFHYDFIEMQDGQFVKMLYFDNDQRTIPVLDLISYMRDDLVKIGDKPLLDLYDAYMKEYIIEKIDIENLINLTNIRNNSLKGDGSNS